MDSKTDRNAIMYMYVAPETQANPTPSNSIATGSPTRTKKCAAPLSRLITIFAKIGLALGGAGCAADKPAATSSVTTGFKMTSSSSATTVAKTKRPSLLNALLPKAIALNPPSMADSGGLPITLTSAWMSIEQIEFEQSEVRGSGEVDGSESEFKGPYAVDLLLSSPLSLDIKSIPALPFKRIKMKLHKAESSLAGIPSQLISNSIYLSGTVGGNQFTYQSPDTVEFEIGGSKPVIPKSGIDLLVSINIANVFKQINMASVPNGATISPTNRYPGTSLCPSIDTSANDIYSCVRGALQKHANFGGDKAGNGNLDASDEKVR